MNQQEQIIETKHLVEVSFPVIMFEVDELKSYGWAVDRVNCPSHNFTYFEVFMYRTSETIALMQQRVNKAEAGKQDRTKQVMQENLAANRTKRWKKEDSNAS